MNLSDKDELPKWQRIKFEIEMAIIKGEYQAGDRVPSVRNLSKMYNIGTSTASNILERLSRDGTLIMEQGIGFKVDGRAIKKLKAEHKKRLITIFEQSCEYAQTIQVDPVEIVSEICGKNKLV